MHDPMTVAFEIRSPIKRKNKFFPEGYRQSLVTIWHVDPEKDGTDDSCGWFMRSRHGDQATLKKIAKAYEFRGLTGSPRLVLDPRQFELHLLGDHDGHVSRIDEPNRGAPGAARASGSCNNTHSRFFDSAKTVAIPFTRLLNSLTERTTATPSSVVQWRQRQHRLCVDSTSEPTAYRQHTMDISTTGNSKFTRGNNFAVGCSRGARTAASRLSARARPRPNGIRTSLTGSVASAACTTRRVCRVRPLHPETARAREPRNSPVSSRTSPCTGTVSLGGQLSPWRKPSLD